MIGKLPVSVSSAATIKHQFRRRKQINEGDNMNMFVFLLQRQLIYFIHPTVLKDLL